MGSLEYLMTVSLLEGVFRAIFFAYGGKKEKIKNNLWLTDSDCLRVSTAFIIRLNGWILLKHALKYLEEKFKEICRKKNKKLTI